MSNEPFFESAPDHGPDQKPGDTDATNAATTIGDGAISVPDLPPGAVLPPGFVVELPPDLEFTPVPRQRKPNSLYAERQRLFIALLTATGSVNQACRRLGCQSDSVYNLRNSPGAESFSAAWEKAVKRGAARVRDTVMDHNIHGIPETLYGPDGTVVAERRRFNTRSQMWVLSHYFPKRFGVSGGITSMSKAKLKKLKEKWHRKWAEKLEKRIEAYQAMQKEFLWPDSEERERFITEGLRLYAIKVEQERYHRINGQIVAADFNLRQLTHIELLMETAGAGEELVYQTGSGGFGEYPDTNVYQSDLTRRIDETRRTAWAAAEEPPRPPPPNYAKGLPPRGYQGGPTCFDRIAGRNEAELMAAEAQALWEACGTEESWEAFWAEKEGRVE